MVSVRIADWLRNIEAKTGEEVTVGGSISRHRIAILGKKKPRKSSKVTSAGTASSLRLFAAGSAGWWDGSIVAAKTIAGGWSDNPAARVPAAILRDGKL